MQIIDNSISLLFYHFGGLYTFNLFVDFWMGKLQNKTIFKNIFLKGTVSIISSDPPCKDDNARFT